MPIPVLSMNARANRTLTLCVYPLETGQWMYVAIRWDSLKKNPLLTNRSAISGIYGWIDETGTIAGDSHNEHNGQSLLPKWAFFNERLEDRKAWLGEFSDPNGLSSVGAGQWIESAGWFVLSAQPQSGSLCERFHSLNGKPMGAWL